MTVGGVAHVRDNRAVDVGESLNQAEAKLEARDSLRYRYVD